MKNRNDIRIIRIFFKYAGVERKSQIPEEVLHKERGCKKIAYDA